MNKLVSKNPIQRFKQGNKIRKMQNASGGPIQYHGQTYILSPSGSGIYVRYNPETKTYDYNKQITSAEVARASQQEKTRLETLAKLKKSGMNVGLYNKEVDNYINKNSQKSNASKKVTSQKKPSYDKFIYANEGKLGGWNRSIGIGNIKDQESLDMIKQLGWEGKNAEEVQNLLNLNDIGGNRVIADNKWGDQSKVALRNYYNRWKNEQEIFGKQEPTKQKSTIQLPQAPVMQRQAISDYSNYASNLKSALGNNNNFQGLSNLVWKEYADDDNSFAANFSRDMRTRFKNYNTQQSWLDNQAAIEKLLNISGRYRGSRSGDYGDLARSQASWAGEYNQGINKQNQVALNNYNALINRYKRAIGGYKIGGQLVSKDPVKRFKQKNFRLVAQ